MFKLRLVEMETLFGIIWVDGPIFNTMEAESIVRQPQARNHQGHHRKPEEARNSPAHTSILNF